MSCDLRKSEVEEREKSARVFQVFFSFSWGHFNSQEKLKTMLMQNFGVTNKEHYGMLRYFWSGQMGSITRHGKPLCHPERIIWEE